MRLRLAWGIFAALVLSDCATRPQRSALNESTRRFAVQQSGEERAISEASGENWVVSTQGRAATGAAERMFRAGGNIIDAAVAASFAISVERPQSTGLGGGGFMLYREAKTEKVYAIDFRERAPRAATEKMYLDGKGEVIPERSTVGIQASGIPGLVKGLAEIHARFGKVPFAKTVEPAIESARSGIRVYPTLANAGAEEIETLKRFPETKRIFTKPDGSAYAVGDILIQKDLAKTLRRVASTRGRDFYSGATAKAIVRTTGGWISEKDLAGYRVKWREPLRSAFRGYEVVTMPPPSSGGAHLLQILKFVEDEPLKELAFQSEASVHRIASGMQRAFLDRARYMGDPDFVKVPIRSLLSEAHLKELKKSFRPDSVLSAEALEKKLDVLPEHSETTHFSIMDRAGNVVVSTQTINGSFGSAVVVDGTGVLLNNEMDDFSAKPGASNMFGAIGGKANSVQGGKTPLSSMTPTIVLENGIPILGVGAPGGTRIINCVAQTILNRLVYGLPLYDSVNAVRFHQQWKPDVLTIEEPGLSPSTESALASIGWNVKRNKVGCAVMAVSREGKTLRGVSEPRDFGQAIAR